MVICEKLFSDYGSTKQAQASVMALATPTRRALSDLPINTFGTPSTKGDIGKDALSNKRPIQVVADPEYAQPALRVRVSPRSQTTLQGETPRQEVGVPMQGG